jgi:hypothetical protein
VIELVPLCVAEMTVGRAHRVGRTPAGQRLIGTVAAGRWDGDRLRSKVAGLGADWLAIGPDGTGMIDARVLLETDDGVLIHVTYQGRADARGDLRGPYFIAPVFETADNRYAWLNRIQAVAKGEMRRRELRYEVFELR